VFIVLLISNTPGILLAEPAILSATVYNIEYIALPKNAVFEATSEDIL